MRATIATVRANYEEQIAKLIEIIRHDELSINKLQGGIMTIKGEPKVFNTPDQVNFLFEVGTAKSSIWIKTMYSKHTKLVKFTEYKDASGYQPLTFVGGSLRKALLDRTKAIVNEHNKACVR